MSTDDFRKEEEEVIKGIKRIMIGLYPEDLKNIDKLIKLRKYGLTKADVIRTAVIYLMEKAEEL